MNANAENASSSEGCLSIGASVLGSIPFTEPTSKGEGMYATTASSKGWIPLFLNAVPHNTGTITPLIVAILIAFFISSSVISSPPKYFSINSSSVSTTDSSMCSLAAWASSRSSALTSSMS